MGSVVGFVEGAGRASCLEGNPCWRVDVGWFGAGRVDGYWVRVGC